MPRNIVICCDGTNNEFGVCNTNVVRLMQVATQDPDKQLVYYDPGVGTLPEPGMVTRIGKKASELMAQSFGTDIVGKVFTAYAQLMDTWEPGDRVFLFGFSRGAYTARVLGGMLHSLGLLPRGNVHLLPYAMRIFRSLRKDSNDYWKLCDNFRWTFARPVPGDDDRRFPIHFIGVWDTVSSVGWIWDPASFPYTHSNPSVAVMRHAVSLDERRAFFRQNLIGNVTGQDAVELWFAGVHSDIGGGYPEKDGGLWRVTFEWMLSEAQAKGLLVDPARLEIVRTRTPVPARPWAEPMHESLTGAWWIAEYFPKFAYDSHTKSRHLTLGRGRPRVVHDGALMYQSVLERLRAGNYSPPNLSAKFVASVKALTSVPDSLPYASG